MILCTIAFNIFRGSKIMRAMKNLITFVNLLQDTDMPKTTH